ncbi:adenosylcobinamide-GDP ribazoletransferase [Thalassovita sp.]|uniref:adenosylcobinamide-GDP ribazoletransferase n=1 Tax=Thalassovita sp. TaxID=1979401 RepID=UPI0029DE72F6|nr:adenosylcobinamide-GDP ribazoletransferase [Thalassovita sp.]
MQKSDQGGIQARDVAVALSLLTRLPLRLSKAAYARGAAASWAYPLAGIVPGGIGGLAGLAALPVGPEFAALVAIALSVLLTGAMHEDGLADVADGFWGGWDRARRLEIMKDSAIGTYGVMALVLGFAARWWALGALFATGHGLLAALAAGLLSRAGMPVLMAALPNARDGGLSRSVGRPGWGTAALAVGLALVLTGAVLGWAMIPATVLAALAVAALGLLAKAKIGGQTGDVLGASQQLSEIAVLVALVALFQG